MVQEMNMVSTNEISGGLLNPSGTEMKAKFDNTLRRNALNGSESPADIKRRWRLCGAWSEGIPFSRKKYMDVLFHRKGK